MGDNIGMDKLLSVIEKNPKLIHPFKIKHRIPYTADTTLWRYFYKN